MDSTSVLSVAEYTSVSFSGASAAGGSGETPVPDFATPLRRALAALVADPASEAAWKELRASRRSAAIALSRFPRKDPRAPYVADALLLIREVSASGVQDRAVQPEDLALARSFATKNWPGLLGGMLLVPSWQWPDGPSLITAPDWMRSDFVAWLFVGPQGFSEVGHAEIFAAQTLRRLEELARWIHRCPGANAEADVLAAYVAHAAVIPLYFTTGNLRRHAELRGQILMRASALPGPTDAPDPRPRLGRPLRIGFVNRHFGSQTETYTTLPTFEQLDPARFELHLFCHRFSGGPLETHCRNRAAHFSVLPEDLAGQLDVLRAAELDVLVFGTNVTAVCNEVTLLALHRIAPLQVVNNSSCITSGLPEADLYISGSLTETATAAADFSERLGLLPGPAHAFNYIADHQEPRVPCTRAEFNIPEDAFVFVSAANYFKIIPEMQHAWAQLLAAVPGSYLLIHPFNPNWASSYPILRFKAEFSAVLAAHGVSASRLIISTLRFPSRSDVKTLLGLGDVYLDTCPFGGVNSLIDPLELGLPVVAWEGQPFRSRMGAALLRSIELPHLIARDAREYHTIAVGLAQDVARRTELRARIEQRMQNAPVFLDVLAASDAMGDLLETAYDELVHVGHAAFRADRTPISAAGADTNNISCSRGILRGDPANAAARHEFGNELVAAGHPGRATLYILAALNQRENSARRWIDLARAFRADGQQAQAVQAVEAGLRLDAKDISGWRLLAELATHFQAADLAREAEGMVRQLETAVPASV